LKQENKKIAGNNSKKSEFFYNNLCPEELERLRIDLKEFAKITLLSLQDEK
jgi:hypothetical protein